jgi:transaldolase
LDDLSRAKLTDLGPHGLPQRITHDGVVGVTTNPSIFNAAISQGSEYASSISNLSGESVGTVVRQLTTDDVRSACDLFASTFHATSGLDGRVSIEVDPRSAHDTDATILEGKALWKIVNRPNAMIKVPATVAGLPAITELIARGISVNATLIFSVERYLQVFEAFMQGLENRVALGESVSEVTSVASFFVSRIDTAVDALLKQIGTAAALSLLGKAAIASAGLAYEAFETQSQSARWQALARKGARIQRPLWASTGVKDPTYSDTCYIVELVAPHTVNTMPQATLDALLDHGVFAGKIISTSYASSREVFGSLEQVGISMNAVTADLVVDGVEKFIAAWKDLLSNVEKVLNT